MHGLKIVLSLFCLANFRLSRERSAESRKIMIEVNAYY